MAVFKAPNIAKKKKRGNMRPFLLLYQLDYKTRNSTRILLNPVRGKNHSDKKWWFFFFFIAVIRLLKTDALSDSEQMIQLSPGDSTP